MSAELDDADLAVDHALAELSGSVSFLLDITPVNADEVGRDLITGQDDDPAARFTYRPLECDPDDLADRLESIDTGSVTDPTLAQLLRARHREIELQLQMLRARDTADFRSLSLELYGGVSPVLRDRAEALMEAIPGAGETNRLTPAEFLEMAHDEIARYRAAAPDVQIHAELRRDVSGVMVDGDTLYVGETAAVTAHRAQALLHHEVGTHLVTHVNGSHQPIRTLATGLAGYDETQEGLAVLAEIGCGGLTLRRLRQLASRVVTVHRMVAGASFLESWRALLDAHVAPMSAFNTTMRIYRSGGFTKDAIYLRGLMDLLDHLAAGGELDLLWLGKFSLRDLPLIGELHQRGVLEPPRLIPRWLDDPETPERLRRAAAADQLIDLIETTEGPA